MAAEELRIGSLCVGMLRQTGGDFPWCAGVFIPSPEFARIEPMLRRRDGDLWLSDDALVQAGWSPETWTLHPEGLQDEEPWFLHALRLRCAADATWHASWRCGVDPLF